MAITSCSKDSLQALEPLFEFLKQTIFWIGPCMWCTFSFSLSRADVIISSAWTAVL